MAATAAAAALVTNQLLQPNQSATRAQLSASASRRSSAIACVEFPAGSVPSRAFPDYRQIPKSAPAASPVGGEAAPTDDAEDGVLLGTLRLPLNTDLNMFETLLFQWANSLCQGANVPLPVPLKVDRVRGGARLGFVEIGDGKTEMPVYIDCLVFPASGGSGPLFRAVRNGPKKGRVPPGEPRIMRSLLQALQKSTEIARTA